jgi:predicted CXXCH cytochrome family protein
MVQWLKRVACASSIALAMVGVAWASGPINVVGISPHEIEEGALHDVWADIAPTSGLQTVEVGTRVVVEAAVDTMGVRDDISDSLETVAWEIINVPANSGILGETGIETVFSFVPDTIGWYKIELTVNGTDVSTLLITAADYVGVGTIDISAAVSPECGACHSDQVDGWELTTHASATERNLSTSYMGESCLECHATGFDSEAWAALGDSGFVFPIPGEGVYDSIVAVDPAQALGFGVQCEACHGPGSQHKGLTTLAQTSVSYGSDVCAQCHDEPSHHPEPIAWDASVHAADWDIQHFARDRCAACHTAQGFVDMTVDGGLYQANSDPDPITCSACHDPHDAPGPANLRLGSVENACTSCHKLRVSSHGIHHSNQGPMIAGTDGMELEGYEYSNSSHSNVDGACATCHMAGLPSMITDIIDQDGEVEADSISLGEAVGIVGGHTFSVVGEFDAEEFVNGEGCVPCHSSVSMEVLEFSQFTIMNLLDELKANLPVAAEGGAGAHEDAGAPVFGGDLLTETEAAAAFNWYFVVNDGSYGVHNHSYAADLLNASIAEVKKTSTPGTIVSITDVPNDQGSFVQIRWNAFAVDDTINSYQIERNDGGRWVALEDTTLIPDSTSSTNRYVCEVSTIKDSSAAQGVRNTRLRVVGTSNSTTYTTPEASGYSFDNIDPLGVESSWYDSTTMKLTWTPSPSSDVQYYAVYQGRILTAPQITGEPYLLVTDTATVVAARHSYGIVAIDFGGNASVFNMSNITQVRTTNIESNPAPATALLGNAPNPFNPSTEISYQLHEATKVTLTVYNILGQPVRTLVSGSQIAGSHSVNWDGRDSNGLHVASGAYIYVMSTEKGFRSNGRMLLLR